MTTKCDRRSRRQVPEWLPLTLIALFATSIACLPPFASLIWVHTAHTVICLSLLVGLFFGLRHCQPPFIARRCPNCGKMTLKQLARARRYHECVNCFVRLNWSRKDVCWHDASGPEAESFFRPRSDGGQWLTYEPPRLGKSNLSVLLRNKWLRNRSGPIKPVAQSRRVPSSHSLHDPWLDG
jgi:hypothetical protein